MSEKNGWTVRDALRHLFCGGWKSGLFYAGYAAALCAICILYHNFKLFGTLVYFFLFVLIWSLAWLLSRRFFGGWYSPGSGWGIVVCWAALLFLVDFEPGPAVLVTLLVTGILLFEIWVVTKD